MIRRFMAVLAVLFLAVASEASAEAVTWFEDYDKAVAAATEQGKPIFYFSHMPG